MKKNKKAYSVIIALLMIWFLFVVVVWVFNMVLKELNDNRWMWNYIKAYFWAEAWQELALLQIKEKWYGIQDNIDLSINNRSIILSDNSNDISLFKWNKEALISYDISVKTNIYTWILNNLWYDIIPLYYLTWTTLITEEKITDLSFSIISWVGTDLVWNIVWNTRWFSWIWSFDGNTFVNIKSFNNSSNEFVLDNESIKDFLSASSPNFLILLNSWNSDLTYNLKSLNTGEYFSKPKLKIFSSSKVWNYKQNLSTDFDNTEYFKSLKYSVYSN